MADQNGSASMKEAESKGKGKAAEPAQEGGMDVDDSSSEEEVDEVSLMPLGSPNNANRLTYQ
jgi:hypothetical protein